MKKLFVLLIITLFLSFSFIPSYANSIKFKDHTFSYVMKILDNELFPEIKEYSKNHFDHSLSNQNPFAVEILDIMKKYVIAKKIYFSIPPMVRVFKLENNINKAYLLEIKMIVYDGEETIPGNIRVGILIGKRFIIKIIDKTKTKVGA